MSSERIEGLPIGTKIGKVRSCAAVGPWVSARLEPDNPYGVLDLTTVPIPEGYERDGSSPEEWFRRPHANERYVHPDWRGPVAENKHNLDLPPRIILRPVKKAKRVLVVEVDEKDCRRSFENLNYSVPGQAFSFLSFHAPASCMRCRIEERDE